MNQQERKEKFDILQAIANEVFTHKDKKYGGSFHKEYQEFGPVSAAIRLSDKLSRYKTLIKNPEIDPGDESLVDTLIDMANYALMAASEEWSWSSPDPEANGEVEETVKEDPIDLHEELKEYNKDELLEIATAMEVTVPKKFTKETIIEKIMENETQKVVDTINALFYGDEDEEDGE